MLNFEDWKNLWVAIGEEGRTLVGILAVVAAAVVVVLVLG